ncbi:hypothetical protein OAV85_00795 [Candidatus Nanopelagicales bacterium]|nr:hypothetical protein [Candidatus Nanopelagicales bacterium]
MKRLGVLSVAGAAAIVLLWVYPPLGLVAVAAFLIIVPPWGRTYAERAVISGIVVLGTAAIVFPRASTTPINPVTSRGFLAAFVVVGVLLYAIPALRRTPLPKLRLVDVLLLLAGVGLTWWLLSAYVGASSQEIVSGLFFSGWDNQAHFTTFANTYVSQATLWPTTDGSVAWNQWYPSLHTTLWAILQYAGGSIGLGRVELLFPYVQWNAVTITLAMVALAWVASDLAGRVAHNRLGAPAVRIAPVLAAAAMAIWIFLGSPQFLYNSGFTNFALGVAVVAAASYLSVRSSRSARTLGWFLIPLAAIAVIGLWTPLVLALSPAGVITAVSLIRFKVWLGVVWLAANAAIAGFLAWQQSGAILAAEGGANAGEFAETIGAVGTGMAPFNLAAAIASPFLAVGVAIALRGSRPLAIGVAAPSVMIGILALGFVPGTDAAGISRVTSYYVLKSLDAALLATAPLLAAAAAVGLLMVMRQLSATSAAVVGLGAGLAGVAAFGYVGVVPENPSSGFSPAPGVQAGAERARGIEDSLIGDSIFATVTGIEDLPEFAPMMWDGSGTLPNLWAATLHEVLSSTQQSFYAGLPEFPYGDETYDYLQESLATEPDLRLAITWFRPTSGEFLALRFRSADPRQVTVVEVPMRASLLCPECSP